VRAEGGLSVSKPEQPTARFYACIVLPGGKEEAAFIDVPLGDSRIKPLSPRHKEQLKEIRRHKAMVPDPRYPNDPTKLLEREVVGEVPSKKWVEHRGERPHLAKARMLEAFEMEKALKFSVRKKSA
jgi:hypothetical protein